MSQYSDTADLSLKASSDLSSSQYRFVKLSSSTTPYGVQIATGTTDVILGILQNKPKTNEAASVRVFGTSKLKIGVALAINAFVTAGSDGTGTPASTDKDIVGGIMMETGSAANDIVEVLITHFKASI